MQILRKVHETLYAMLLSQRRRRRILSCWFAHVFKWETVSNLVETDSDGRNTRAMKASPVQCSIPETRVSLKHLQSLLERGTGVESPSRVWGQVQDGISLLG